MTDITMTSDTLASETATQETFAQIMTAISDDDARNRALEIAVALDARAEFERSKNSDNDSIQKHLKSARAKLTTLSVARFMIAANVSVSYFNEQERVNARRNVYAILKLADIARAVAVGDSHNAINLSVLRSLFKFASADVEFSHKHALASASDKITIDATVRKHLVRHTVSASTASTQASSTMSALEASRVVNVYQNDKSEQCYRLNDNALVAALRDKLSA